MVRRIGSMPKRNAEKVIARAFGMCEAGCGKPGTQIHHRRFLSRGGGHNLGNLVYLCGFGNAGGCHGLAHSGSYRAQGWEISRYEQRHEVDIPFIDLHGDRWILWDSGEKIPAELVD